MLAYARPRELVPSSIRSSTSCHGTASISAGEPEISDREPHAHTEASATRRRSKRFRLADPGFRGSRTIHENPTLRAHVRCACAHRPPRAAVPDRCQSFTGAACEPNITVGSSLSRVTPARSARLGGRAAHASRLPKGLGLTSPGRSAKSDRDRQYPRCFPSLAACLTIRAYVQMVEPEGFSPQLLTSLWKELGAFFAPRLVRQP